MLNATSVADGRTTGADPNGNRRATVRPGARVAKIAFAIRADKLPDMAMDRADLERVLETLGRLLDRRGQRFELVVVGGSSLLLLGLIPRPTRDLDVVALVEEGGYRMATPLPLELESAAADVGRALGLGEEWLNAGPTDLLRLGLPPGFENRVETRRWGGLTLHIASRFDQICFKLYAAADQGPRSKHFADLQALRPSRSELLPAARWARTHDPSQGFRQLLIQTLQALGVEAIDDEL